MFNLLLAFLILFYKFFKTTWTCLFSNSSHVNKLSCYTGCHGDKRMPIFARPLTLSILCSRLASFWFEVGKHQQWSKKQHTEHTYPESRQAASLDFPPRSCWGALVADGAGAGEEFLSQRSSIHQPSGFPLRQGRPALESAWCAGPEDDH